MARGYDGWMTEQDDLVIEFTPALVVLLLAAERSKGSPLTEDEVVEVRDNATCIRLRRSASEALAAERGYADLDPERCFEEWQIVRTQLSS